MENTVQNLVKFLRAHPSPFRSNLLARAVKAHDAGNARLADHLVRKALKSLLVEQGRRDLADSLGVAE